jgi:hypothetical protein
VQVTVGKRKIHVGYFASEVAAGAAAQARRRELMSFAVD